MPSIEILMIEALSGRSIGNGEAEACPLFPNYLEMAKSRSSLRSNSLLPVLWILIASGLPSGIYSIRTDIEFRKKHMCRNTVQGRHLISDDNGYVCTALSINSWSRCCPESGDRFSCQGCNLVSRCCSSYEHCVSCCLSPSRTQKDLAQKVKIAKPATAGTYAGVFEFCSGICRHNSASVVHENAYASDYHHCFSMHSNFSGLAGPSFEARLTDINVIIGRQGESCYSACNSRGQSCVPTRLYLLNKCEYLQKYMSCRGLCFASTGSDQPAEVVDDAPNHLNPGACLYTQDESMLSCDGSHQHTRRLCPCA